MKSSATASLFFSFSPNETESTTHTAWAHTSLGLSDRMPSMMALSIWAMIGASSLSGSMASHMYPRAWSTRLNKVKVKYAFNTVRGVGERWKSWLLNQNDRQCEWWPQENPDRQVMQCIITHFRQESVWCDSTILNVQSRKCYFSHIYDMDRSSAGSSPIA